MKDKELSGIVGTTTSNGIEISSVSVHAVVQAAERNVSKDAASDAVTNPLNVGDVKIDRYGRQSQQFLGSSATVVVSSDTGVIATMWETGERYLKKYS